MFKRKASLAMVVVAIAVAAVVVVVVQSGVPDLAQGDDAPTLRAFHGERTSEDVLPELAATELTAIAPAGTRVADSVRAVTDGDATVFLTPAPGDVCLSLLEPGGATVSCVPDAAVRDGAARPSSMATGCRVDAPRRRAPNTVTRGWPRCTGDLVLYGAVSDRVSAVTVEVERGPAPHATVANNAYLARVPLSSGPTAVRATGDGVDAVQPVRRTDLAR